MSDIEPDEGGEAPCYAHLIDEPSDDPLDHEALIMGLADAVIVADSMGTITVWNDAATRLFGFEANEAVGQTLDLIIPRRLQRRHWDGYRKVMPPATPGMAGGQMLQVPAEHKDGHTFSVAFTVTLLSRPGEQRPHAIAAVLRDDSERYELSRAARGQGTQAGR